jgi:hypothetical protein
MYGCLFGLKPNKLNDTTIRFTGGSVGSFLPEASVGHLDVVNFLALANDVDLATNGIGGLDTGSPAPCIIASAMNAGAVLPAGFVVVRKLAFGIVLDGAARIRDFHASNGPHWTISYTGIESTGDWLALGLGITGEATDWTDVSLVKWVPDNSRYVRLETETVALGQAGSSFIRVLANTGMRIDSANPGLKGARPYDVGLTSARTFQYRVTGGAKLSVRVQEYRMTEPTI